MNIIKRPAPVGVTTRGFARLDPAECAAYRKARGVTQTELADFLRCSQSLISVYEGSRAGYELQERTMLPVFDAIDAIAARQAKMVREGLAELDAIRSKQVPYVGPVSEAKPHWRTVEEANTDLIAQGRGEEAGPA